MRINMGNCWNTLRVIVATAWLGIASANAKEYYELGNQQPSRVIAEGSETKLHAPVTGEDIVQHATQGHGNMVRDSNNNMLLVYLNERLIKVLDETVWFYQLSEKYPLPDHSGTSMNISSIMLATA